MLAETPPRRALAPDGDPDRTRVRPRGGAAADEGDEAAAGAAEVPPARSPERRFDRRHLVVLAAIVGLGVLVALYALSRARAIPVEPVVVQSGPPAPAVSASPTPVAVVRVHVLGAVRRPGVVTLGSGARVQDAIDSAGGLTDQARPGELNLAAPLVDGQQVVVGDTRKPGGEVRGADTGPAGTTSGAAGPSAARGRLNLNTATAEQLDALPGVGPVTAQKIVAWRTEHHRFTKVAELQEVPGIGPKSFSDLEPLVTI